MMCHILVQAYGCNGQPIIIYYIDYIPSIIIYYIDYIPSMII